MLQKSAFLASTDGVELSIHFNKKLGAGFSAARALSCSVCPARAWRSSRSTASWSNTRSSGSEAYRGHRQRCGFGTTVDIDIQQVPGLKNKLFGGEGLFNTTLTGPGRVWLQTMPISGIAQSVAPFLPSSGSN